MNFKKNRGFTLIELLVVIAIIGILSSVVLASLNTAREKGQIAAVKSSMQSIRVQAELYYDDNGSSYGTADLPDDVNDCEVGTAADLYADPTVEAALTEIQSPGRSITGSARCGVGVGGQTWAVSITLLDGTNWCTDSTGRAIAGTATMAAIGNNIDCQ